MKKSPRKTTTGETSPTRSEMGMNTTQETRRPSTIIESSFGIKPIKDYHTKQVRPNDDVGVNYQTFKMKSLTNEAAKAL